MFKRLFYSCVQVGVVRWVRCDHTSVTQSVSAVGWICCTQETVSDTALCMHACMHVAACLNF